MTARSIPNERPFVTVTARGATLADMRAQATIDIVALLGTDLVTVGCDGVEPVEQVGSASGEVSRVLLWEAKFRGGWDYKRGFDYEKEVGGRD